jgi:hypothetical protein
MKSLSKLELHFKALFVYEKHPPLASDCFSRAKAYMLVRWEAKKQSDAAGMLCSRNGALR